MLTLDEEMVWYWDELKGCSDRHLWLHFYHNIDELSFNARQNHPDGWCELWRRRLCLCMLEAQHRAEGPWYDNGPESDASPRAMEVRAQQYG